MPANVLREAGDFAKKFLRAVFAEISGARLVGLPDFFHGNIFRNQNEFYFRRFSSRAPARLPDFFLHRREIFPNRRFLFHER